MKIMIIHSNVEYALKDLITQSVVWGLVISGSCQKCRISGLAAELLKQNLHVAKIPGDLSAQSIKSSGRRCWGMQITLPVVDRGFHGGRSLERGKILMMELVICRRLSQAKGGRRQDGVLRGRFLKPQQQHRRTQLFESQECFGSECQTRVQSF